MRIYRLENTVQRYAWGSVDGLESALGIPNPDKRPAAELWMGAHPGAPSMALLADGNRVRLDEFIASDPAGTLGARVASRFGNTLPFLFKGLSAGTPLSIQTHPDKKTAEAGFARENAAGIPLSSPVRTYRDDNHKPEMTLALTRFEGLCGFRKPAEIARNLELVLGPHSARRFLSADGDMTEKDSTGDAGSAGDSALLRGLVSRLLGLRGKDREDILASALTGSAELLASWPEGMAGPGGIAAAGREAFAWVSRLPGLYPGDAGILMPLVLNHIVMQPGEAVFIGAGIMHAYLSGTALEIMANSDNVIRGGLTPKHIDLPELLAVVDFEPSRPGLESPGPETPGNPTDPGTAPVTGIAAPYGSNCPEACWPAHTAEFALGRIELRCHGNTGFSFLPDGPEIILCSERSVRLSNGDDFLDLTKGESVFVRADAGLCRLEGCGTIYRARVPA